MNRILITLPIAIVACNGQSGIQPEQLEAFEATADPVDDPYASFDGSGAARVTGGERDWTLALGEGAEETLIDLHTPGGSDLSAADGRELTVHLGDSWGDPTRVARISDEVGPLFLVQLDELGPASDLFGADFARRGDEVGTGIVDLGYGDFDVSYRLAAFRTDDGEVETLPGEPVDARIGGQAWRIVVHGSFEVTDTPDAMPGCGGGLSDTLAFEMIRIDAAPDLEPMGPESGARMAGASSCG